MATMQIFAFEETEEIRTLLINDEPYFVANDIAKVLGYKNPSDATNKHCKRSLKRWGSDSLGRRQEFKVIPESDMYRLIIKSNLPDAEKFENWVMEEVLPTIRKHGAYLTDEKALDITTNPNSLADLLLQAGEQLKQKDLIIKEMQPKALFSDAVRGSKNSCLIKDLATILKQNGVDIGQNRLFDWLRENGYLCTGGRRHNQPTQRSLDLKVMDVRAHVRTNKEGELVTRYTPLITGKGQLYFVNKFLVKEEL